jgi:hypothetical protein
MEFCHAMHCSRFVTPSSFLTIGTDKHNMLTAAVEIIAR